MGRWLRVLLGPLPATILLLPMLLAGGLGTLMALLTWAFAPGHSWDDRWAGITGTLPILLWVVAAGIGVLALWVAVLADSPAALRAAAGRWWLAAGLGIGVVAASRWMWLLATGTHATDASGWALWLVLLAGPLVLGIYYLGVLVRA